MLVLGTHRGGHIVDIAFLTHRREVGPEILHSYGVAWEVSLPTLLCFSLPLLLPPVPGACPRSCLLGRLAALGGYL